MKGIIKSDTDHSPGTEGGRTRPTGVPGEATTKPDPEVVAQPKRRRLSISYKLKVLAHVENLRSEGNGAIGAYLRKEGIYYSMVHTWSKQKDLGLFTGAHGAKKKEKSRDVIVAENKELRRKLEQIEKRLHKTELLVELQKKISAMMELENQSESERSAV